MYVVELFKATRRVRTWILGIALGGIPIIIVVSLVLTTQAAPSGEDAPPFYALIVRSGFFAPLASLGVLQVFLLPLAAGLLSGDAIAGEASGGTLRYLLARPVGRSRLLLTKYAAALTLIVALVAWVIVIGLTAGGLAYGLDPLPTLSGATLGTASAIVRIFGAGLYIATGMAGLAALGILVSTLTESGPGATVVTVGFAIVCQILDSLSALEAIQPFLLTHRWLAFADLFRAPIDWGNLTDGLIIHTSYAVVLMGAALVLFRRKDILA